MQINTISTLRKLSLVALMCVLSAALMIAFSACIKPINCDDSINMLLNSEEFSFSSKDEQVTLVKNLIDEMVKAGEIQDSVQYNADDMLFSFKYANGSLGGIDLSTRTNETNGSNYSTAYTNNYFNGLFDCGEAYADSSQKKMHILFAFDESRKQNYLNVEQEWRNMGLDTSVDYDVTVEDLSKLKGYDGLMFSMHGSTYETRPVFCLLEQESSVNYEAYREYIDKGLIASVYTKSIGSFNKEYWVFPEFFGEVYNKKELSNTCVMSETCRFLGIDGQGELGIDRSFPNNFEHAGAACSFGFRNSVSGNYSIKMNVGMVDKMVDNYSTIGDAFNSAKNQFGADDSNYQYDEKKYTATPYLFGNTNFSLEDEGKEKNEKEKEKSNVQYSADGWYHIAPMGNGTTTYEVNNLGNDNYSVSNTRTPGKLEYCGSNEGNWDKGTTISPIVFRAQISTIKYYVYQANYKVEWTNQNSAIGDGPSWFKSFLDSGNILMPVYLHISNGNVDEIIGHS